MVGIGAVVVAVGARRSVREGVLLGASAGLFWAASDTSIKALSGELGDSSWAMILFSPLAVVIAAGSIVGLVVSARSLQIGKAVPVIAITSVAANALTIAAGPLVFEEPFPDDAARRGAAPVRVRAGDRGRRPHPGARQRRRGRARAGARLDLSRAHTIGRMAAHAIVVAPGKGRVLGNVEFLARTADSPRFNFSIIEIVAGRELESHVHDAEDDAFYILEGELIFTLSGDEVSAGPGTFVLVPPGVEHGFRNDGADSVRMLNIHAPGGFDRRIGLPD